MSMMRQKFCDIHGLMFHDDCDDHPEFESFTLGYQAATEAAKATGTAVEQKPRAWLIEYEYLAGVTLKGEGLRRTENWAKTSFVSDSKDYADHPDFEQEGARNIVVTPLLPAEAARQPAPVLAVKTWQERLRDKFPETEDRNLFALGHLEHAMEAEIADLRAELAKTNNLTTLDDARIKMISCGHRIGSEVAVKFARAILDAATNRSQP